MSGLSAIQWTDRVWNPVVGCTKVSQGCKHCYAKTLHDQRHKAYTEGKLQNLPQYAAPFEAVQLIPDRLHEPLSWRKPAKVFVNSVSDLFHEDVPDHFIAAVFGVMGAAPRHTFQILTKRPARMLELMSRLTLSESFLRAALALDDDGFDQWRRSKVSPPWPLPNVWLGVSVENQAAADERTPLLLQTPAAIRFLSCEPLLECVDLTRWLWGKAEPCADCPKDVDCECGYQTRRWLGQPSLDWIVIGGESGRGARPFNVQWARDLVKQCRDGEATPFVKQLGADPVEAVAGMEETRAVNEPFMGSGWAHKRLRDNHGGDMAEWPEDLRVREFPAIAEAVV